MFKIGSSFLKKIGSSHLKTRLSDIVNFKLWIKIMKSVFKICVYPNVNTQNFNGQKLGTVQILFLENKNIVKNV